MGNARAVVTREVVATGLVLMVRALLATLDQVWTRYSLLQGPLALAALLLAWSWVISLLVLFGTFLVSHVKVMKIEGRVPRKPSLATLRTSRLREVVARASWIAVMPRRNAMGSSIPLAKESAERSDPTRTLPFDMTVDGGTYRSMRTMNKRAESWLP